jgi:pimeloyl-ACP methyl ester carboxylesterase
MIAATSNWTGTYRLPRSAPPVAIVVRISGSRATVSLGPGHAYTQHVGVTFRGTRIRFVLPGSPANVVFAGTVGSSRLRGTVVQGRRKGSFSLRRGRNRILELLGAYRGAKGREVAVTEASGLHPFLTELPSGATHGIARSLSVGRRLGDTSGYGRIAVDASGFIWRGTHYRRLLVRQREIRVGVDAATLSLPPGAGRFPAAAMVHGSGPSTRNEFDVFTAWLLLHGVAVLADDKRGVGQSGGVYPGDQATTGTLRLLARDAQAEVAFLGKLPQVDQSRVGLWGDSQGGWISVLAASRDSAVRWLVENSGPTVTVGEADYWASLAGESLSPPSGTFAQMLEQVEAQGPSGFDPAPYLRSLTIPGLWMFGADDRNIPTQLCVQRLQQVKTGHAFSWNVLPTAHTPLVLPTGLLSSLPRSPGFDPHFFADIAAWLRGHAVKH